MHAPPLPEETHRREGKPPAYAEVCEKKDRHTAGRARVPKRAVSTLGPGKGGRTPSLCWAPGQAGTRAGGRQGRRAPGQLVQLLRAENLTLA